MKQATIWEKFGIKIDKTSQGNVKAYYSFINSDTYFPSVTVLGSSRNSIFIAVKHARKNRKEHFHFLKTHKCTDAYAYVSDPSTEY